MTYILIIADEWDPHADKVAARLKESGGEICRLDLNVDALRRVTFALDDSGGWLNVDGRILKTGDITAVWCRRTSVVLSLQEERDRGLPGFQLWRNEWNRHLYWLFYELRDAFWLNDLISGALADNKRHQMAAARKIGLNTPGTISSNDAASLINFAASHGDVAVKFLNQSTIQSNSEYLGVYVNKINIGTLREFGGAEENPIILQPYIKKKFEVRYTVVGERHYVCQIDSQNSLKTTVDWRRYDLGNTPHQQISAPPEIKEMVSAFMKALRIGYGALDFVVDESGRWWFLEVNSNGQWLWIEELTGLDISGGIANLLIEKQGEHNDNVWGALS
jgi:glutathione synthase/RimK-type ligase-like ATP-grasp enzyme